MPPRRGRGRKRSTVKGITPGRVGAYRSLRKEGLSTLKAAKIANKGKTFAGRSAMAKRGARHSGHRVFGR
jgi:hypothetical protein